LALSEAKPATAAIGNARRVEIAKWIEVVMLGFASGSAQPARQPLQRWMYLPALRHPLG
jgi:hypothetical protein